MIISLILLFLAGVFIPGIISMVKAKLTGRKAPSILQPMYDILKLFKKGNVYSTTSTLIFQIAPVISFSTIVLALLFVPVGKYPGLLSFEGDFVFFAYIIGLGRFLMVIAAMDTGSGFEGMGANREAFYSLIAEPVFFILFGSLALLTGQTSFYDIFNLLHTDTLLSYFFAGLSVYVLFWISMIEGSRLPVDDPKTHLELTMVHEVIVLDHSGFELALIQLTAALKFAIFGTLIFNIALPMQNNYVLPVLLFPVVQTIFASFVAMVETFRARNKMQKNAQWIVLLSALAILIFTSVLIITGKILF
ncbi:MAG: NADH-quinone oxidoreductase subunit H [Bacteroidales bacterium]|nr:NADH-quinone oxidoreductase subunit H [Bacteroidales bacterium]